MEMGLCIVSGMTTVAVSIALFWVRTPKWNDDRWTATPKSRMIQWWYGVQRIVRKCTNSLLALIGLAVLACAFVPHGGTWMAIWLMIFLALLTVLLLAGLDALISIVVYREAVPESARQTMSRGEPHPYR